jgi:hypothetical protein
MHKSIDVPRITLPTNITPDSPQDLIEALTIVRESDNITKETTLETLKDMGITAEEIAAHLGMSTEDLLSEDFDFPLDVHPLHIESAIRKVHTKRIGAGFYTTRMGGRTYTIGGKVTVKVYPADDQHWHEDDDWDTTVEAIVYKIGDNEVQLMPVISYEPGNLNLMDVEEWQSRQNGFSGNPLRIQPYSDLHNFGTRTFRVLRAEEPREQDKPTIDEFRDSGFTCLHNVSNFITPLEWRRMHALNGWVATQSIYTA